MTQNVWLHNESCMQFPSSITTPALIYIQKMKSSPVPPQLKRLHLENLNQICKMTLHYSQPI